MDAIAIRHKRLIAKRIEESNSKLVDFQLLLGSDAECALDGDSKFMISKTKGDG
jgi:hypothetical protein